MKKNKKIIDHTTSYGLTSFATGICSGFLIEEVLNATSDDYLSIIFLASAEAALISMDITLKKMINDNTNKYVDFENKIKQEKTKKLGK